MSARSEILAAVRKALGVPRAAPAAIEAQAAALLLDLDPARPPRAAEPAEAFFGKIEDPAFAASIERVESFAALPEAVRNHLAPQRIGVRLCLQPQAPLLALDWSGLEIHHEAAPDEAATLALALWGVAETGSAALESGPDSRVLNLFLPLRLMIALPASRVLAQLEDYAAARSAAGDPPRNAILMTGASGTSDIEGSYVRGAHGPRFLHVFLIEDRPHVPTRSPQKEAQP